MYNFMIIWGEKKEFRFPLQIKGHQATPRKLHVPPKFTAAQEQVR